MEATIFLAGHIGAGAVGLASGYLALFARKGSRLHSYFGRAFVLAMGIMGLSGSYLAFYKPEALSVLTGLLTFYLAVSSWLTIRVTQPARATILVPAAFALCIAGFLFCFGYEALGNDSGFKDGFPPPHYFLFGTIALFAATRDLILLVRGKLSPSSRIVRHLWRMLVALLVAAVSFFLGQQQVFPERIRHWYFLVIPPAVVLVALPYWLLRARGRFGRPNKALANEVA